MPIVQDNHGWALLATQAADSDVLCCPSLNLEHTVEGDFRYPPGVKVGDKNLVASISDTFDPETGKQIFRVTFRSEHVLEKAVEPGHWGPAGSSFNVAMALRMWGVHKPAVFAPIGAGPGGDSLKLTFQRDGLLPALFESHAGTPRTLTIRDSRGQSTLLCRKVEYLVARSVWDWVAHAGRHKMVIATGVKPMDMPLVNQVYFHQERATRVLTPHKELIKDEALRLALLNLFRRTHLLQVNSHEASLLLEEEVTLANAESAAVRLRELSGGAALVIITLGAEGAVLSTPDGVLHQEIFPVEVLDPSGGGDAHLAAFIYCHFKLKLKFAPSLRVAAWVASRVISKVGPWVGLPTGGQLHDKMVELV